MHHGKLLKLNHNYSLFVNGQVCLTSVRLNKEVVNSLNFFQKKKY